MAQVRPPSWVRNSFGWQVVAGPVRVQRSTIDVANVGELAWIAVTEVYRWGTDRAACEGVAGAPVEDVVARSETGAGGEAAAVQPDVMRTSATTPTRNRDDKGWTPSRPPR